MQNENENKNRYGMFSRLLNPPPESCKTIYVGRTQVDGYELHIYEKVEPATEAEYKGDEK